MNFADKLRMAQAEACELGAEIYRIREACMESAKNGSGTILIRVKESQAGRLAKEFRKLGCIVDENGGTLGISWEKQIEPKDPES